ncbi:hypothetical protein [Kribbella sp. NPDC023855]|uniref:hypothetical protein n=1 Tax=Kribbella sp. NPDC023855 TaxID=3154698 RepID=UPI0033FE6B27
MPTAHSTPPKHRLGATLVVAAAALLSGLVVAFGPSLAQGANAGPALNGPKPPAITIGTATGTTAERSAQAKAFTACMRQNGVPDFPGVTVTANGTLQLVPGTNINPISKTYQAAARKCASTLPSGTTLPAEPSLPTPSVPALSNLNCTGTACPAAPKPPTIPN